MSISAKGPPWTYEAYAGLPSDGRCHEIVDGDHYMNPAPNLYHQTVSRRLQFQLYSAIELKGLGVVFDAPVDVQLTDHDIVQPDLVVVTNSKRHIMTPTKIKGIPDLLVEILSPSNPTHDTVTKRSAYERCLVPEYWMVDTEEHKIVQLILDDLTYRESLATDQITMHMPPHVRVDLTMVW